MVAGPDIYISIVYLFCGFTLSLFYNLSPNSKKYGRIAIRLVAGYTLGSVLCLQILRLKADDLKTWEWYIIASFSGLCLSLVFGFLKYIADMFVGVYFGLIVSSFIWADVSQIEANIEGSQLISDSLSIICGFIVLVAGRTENYLHELMLTFVHAVCGAQIFLQAVGCFWSNVPVVHPYWIFFYSGAANSFEAIQCQPPATLLSDRLSSMGIVLGVGVLCGFIQIIIFSIRANCLLSNWRERPYVQVSTEENDEDDEEMFNASSADIENDEGALAEFSLPVNGFTNNGLVCFISSVIQALRVVDPLMIGLRGLPDLSDFSLALLPKALNTSIIAIRDRIDSKRFPKNKQADAHEFLLYLLSLFQTNGGTELVTRCFQAHIDRKVQCIQCGKVSNLPTEPVFDVLLSIQNQTSLNRAWSKEFATETIKDYYCESCQNLGTARKTTNLIPPVNPEFHLIVTLKWFVDDTKINQNFDIPFVMDVGGIPWSLSSIVFHSGNSPKEGHFYTWSKWQGQWYECNDTRVSSVQPTSAGRMEVYDIPYILIFRRMEADIDGTEEIISYRYVQNEEKKLIKQAKAKELNEFEMDKFDSRMRVREKPATRVYYRICLIFTIIFGAWWVIWLVFFGSYWTTPMAGLEYVIYVTAEIVNYSLNMIYFFNFWKPVNRRWRSLNNLKPEFTGRPTVNIIICHYQEDIDDTRRTFAACLNLITDGKVKVNIFICDDGFFETKGGKRVVSMNGTKMNQMMREELIKYWSEKGFDNISMSVPIDIKTLENRGIVRPDCAIESNRYEFKPRRGDGKLLPGPHAFLIARVKPPNPHHKAGNLNNCIYNERLQGEFVVLFDNDMAPLPKFLMRTIPWFYRQTKKARYRLDEGVAFIQCPQDFENVDTADFLGNRNSIFFNAIQKGRDGHDSCAFAGTNAVFLLKAIHGIGGIPYGTVTEDAYAGICLHKKGYRSIYLEEKLAVGLAPETSAQSMVQRMRWVKGSIQILLLPAHFHDDMSKQAIQFTDSYRHPKITIPPKMQIKEDRRLVTRFFRMMFRLDTVLYPFSAITAIMYMVVTVLFVFSNQTPIGFSEPGSSGLNGYTSFVYTFLPYFLFRFLANLFSVGGAVSANDVWRSQEIWFSYAFCSLVGVVDAFYQKITGKQLFSWGNTGAASYTNWLEWFNILAVFVMLIGMITRTIAIFRGTECFTDFAGLMFTGSIAMQMWPMVSISLWQRIYNRYSDGQVKKAGRVEIPNYLLFTITVVLGILISEAGSAGKCVA